ncbi:MAG: YggS family pyridoxal phosphate-dependent enzyme, partial [Longimicrobiales bacterium]
ETLPRIREAIDNAARRVGRGEGKVTLVAVTKAHPLQALEAALSVGISHIGENRLEEMAEKVGFLGRDAATWHMVGHVQSRKARQAVQIADLIHSVDSLRLGRRLSSFALEEGRAASILVQVNASGESVKSGFEPAAAAEAIHRLLELPGLKVRGLMTMAPFVEDEKTLRRTFRKLRQVHEEAGRVPGYEGAELSMGMTNDFELAVEEGSTMVRIGTALLGERPR